MLIVIAAGWLIAYAIRAVVRGILRISKFERLSENAGTARLLNKAALPSSSELLSRFVFWIIWLGFVLLGLSSLGFGLQDYVSRLFLYLPRVLVALLILLFGLAAASFFARATLLAAVNSNWRSPRLISGTVRFSLVVLALAMAFEQLGLAEGTIITAFSILFGALMLGLAIAFGLGGKDLARRALERRFSEEPDREREDELSPL
jgi:mechanosensitive ion channel-like protein